MDPDDLTPGTGGAPPKPGPVSPFSPRPMDLGPSAPPTDDVARVYGDAVTAEQQSALASQMRARAKARRPPPAPPPPPPKPEAAKPAAGAKPAASGAEAPAAESTGRPGFLEQSALFLVSSIWEGMGMSEKGGTPTTPEDKARGDANTADVRGAVDDMARTDVIGAGVRGVRDMAVNAPGSLATFATGAGNKGVELYNDYLAAPFLDMLGMKGGAAQARQWSTEARARQAEVEAEAQKLTATINSVVPSLGESDTNTGKFLEGIASWVAMFALTKKLAPGQVGGNVVADVTARGAFVNVAAFDPKAPTLANLIEDFNPALKDAWFTATSIEESDTGFEAQFKRAIEGVGLDAAVETVLLQAARMTRAQKKAEVARSEGADAAAEDVRTAADTTIDAERAVAALGDSGAPDISDAPPPQAKMFQGTLTPPEQAALTESALRRAGVIDVRTGGLSLDELDAAYGGGRTYEPADVLDMMDQVKAGARPKPLLTFVRNNGGIRETSTFAGEVSSIEAPRLLNRNSVHDLDSMAARAAEAGYIPTDEYGRYDVNDLIDGLKRDFAAENGRDTMARVYSRNDAEDVAKLPGLLQLEKELADLGVDPRMRGPKKRQQAAEEAARRAAAASLGGEARTIDDLEALQADMDAAGVAGFQTFDQVMEAADTGLRDAEGLFNPESLAQAMPEQELAAAIGGMSDSEAFGSALTYLDLEAKTGDEARQALLRNALEHQRRAKGGEVLNPDEKAALQQMQRESGAPVDEGVSDDVAERVGSAFERLRGEVQTPAAAKPEEPWQSFAGQKAMAERLLRFMDPEKAKGFIDSAISMATDAEHKVGLQRVKEIINNTSAAKFADRADDLMGRAEVRLRPKRELSQREASILEDIVASSEAGVDPLAHLNALGVQGDAAREIISHALQQGRLGPKAAARAAQGAKRGGMLEDARARVPEEVTDEQIMEAAEILSPLQFEVWKLGKDGHSAASIAGKLDVGDGTPSPGTVKVVLSRIRKVSRDLGKDWLNVNLADRGQVMSETTRKMIDLKARGVRNVDIAARFYPDVDIEVGASRVAVLMAKWRDELKARKADLASDKDAKFAEWSQMSGERLPDRIPPETPPPDVAAMLDARLPKNATEQTRKIVAWSGYEAPPAWIARWLEPEATQGELDKLVQKIWAVRKRNEPLIWDIFEKVTPRGQASDMAKGWDPANGPEPSAPREHVDALATEIVRQFGKEGEALLKSGAVVLHSSDRSVPVVLPRNTIQAVHSNGAVHIVGNRVSPQLVYGIMLHEVGVHAGMREMLGEDGFSAVIKALHARRAKPMLSAIDDRVRASTDDFAADAAYRRTPPSTKAEHVDEEMLAYYIQHAPTDASLFRRITAGMAAWMYRNFPNVTKWIKPSQEALRQLAVRSLRRYSKRAIDRQFELGGDNDHIGFYSAVQRSLYRMGEGEVAVKDLLQRLRETPGVNEAELRDLGLEQALKGKATVPMGKVRQLVADRKVYLDRKVSTVRGEKGAVAPGSATDVRDVVFRLPSDTPGGSFSRTGGREGGKLSVARISTRKTTDGREIMQVESLDSDVHPQNGYDYLRPEVVDPDVLFRQEQLRAAMDGARRPLDELEAQGIDIASSLPEYRAWREKRQELLNDIAKHGDHTDYMAGQMGVRLPPRGTPLRNWAAATIRNLLASASVTDVDGLAIPVSKMLKDPTPGQQQFLDVEVKQALAQAAKDLDVELGTAVVKMGKLGDVEVPVVWLSPLDRARLAQSGAPMYAEGGSLPPGGSGAGSANHMRLAGPGGQSIYINPARIAADGDIKATIQKLADRYADEVNARRGTERQPDDQLLASVAAVDAWETLKNRRQGEPLGAKESLATRQLWAASAEWVTQIADRYRQTKSPTDKFAFNQALAVHRAIQAEVIGARTETARALRSWAIPMGSTAEKLEQISGILTTQGVGNIDELAGRLARLGQDQVGVLDEVIEKSFRAKTADVLGEIWRASLLSNPKTHIVNLLSNTSVIALDLAETALAGGIARLPRWMGGNPELTDMLAEAALKYEGVMAAFRAQMKFFHENRRFTPTGGVEIPTQIRVPGQQTDVPRSNAVSAESFGLKGESLAGATADVVGAVLNTPQALLGGADDFFKGINFQAEIYAQAHRAAAGEVKAGTLPKEQMSRRIAEIIEAPSESMQVAAKRAAQERTFTTPPAPGGVVSAVFKVRDWMNASGLPLGHFILPFINTPANIMKWTFSRTPAGLLMREMQAKLRSGGKDAQMAKVQIAMGTMGLMTGYQLAASGAITGGGPVDPAERQALQRAGWQPYSVKIGDTWVAYQRFDPLATYLALSSDLQEITANMADGDEAVQQAGEAVALAIGSIGNAFLSKTYLQGVSDFNAFLADPGRYGERYLSNIAGSMMGPAGAAEIRRQVDPTMRDVTSIIDAIKNRWPGSSQDLPVARDLWGRPRMYQSHLGMAYDALSPFVARKVDPEPVDAEMLRLGYFPQMPNRSVTVPVGGRTVSVPLRNRPDIYNRILELSGERALKMANDLVKSPGYQNLLDGSEPGPGTKAFAIETVILRNREIGRAMAMREFWGDLQDIGRKELARELEGALAQ